LAGATPEEEDAAANYGLNLGIAFQLVDDALDYASPTSDTGKPEWGDLREGKVTLPLILMMEDGDTTVAELLDRLKKSDLTDEESEAILARVREGRYSEKTRDEAAAYVEKAKSCLESFAPGEEVTVLKQAADFVLTRTK
jgi:octaprenyl-diphosphate synthase